MDCFSPKGLRNDGVGGVGLLRLTPRNDGEKELSLREVGTTSWQST
ncbi:hypothetical protein VQF75_000184 [Campylobacter upsaliensis]|nr:hypothetical protein [Campylobacter upsaliensis]